MNNELNTWINELLHNRGWSQRELARRADISVASINLVLNDQQQPTFDFCAAIAKAAEVPPEDIFRLAKLLPGPQMENETVREIVSVMRSLSVEQRQDILNYALWRYRQSQESKQ